MRLLVAYGIVLALFVVSTSGQKKVTNPGKPENQSPPPIKDEKVTPDPQSKPPVSKPSAANTKQAAPAVDEDALEKLTKKAGLDKMKGARILAMLPMSAYSHTTNYMPIFKELARRGHHITMLSPFPQKEPLANWEDIVVENTLEKMQAGAPSKDITDMPNSFISKLFGIMFFADRTVEMLAVLPEVQNLYNDNSREFDLVFVEAQFVQEPFLAFGWKYKVPVITLFPSYVVPEVTYFTGNPVFTSTYVPNMVFDTTNNMNLFERFQTTAYTVLKLIMYNVLYLPKMEAHMQKYFPSPDRPYIADLLFNVSFTLLDSNPLIVYPYPRTNNMREFLGINTKPDTPLTPELQKIMDDAGEHGVLLFTFGSHVKPSTMKPHIIPALMHAFANIPQTVIMKWDKDEPPANMSPNVHLVKWLPQAGILRHKNCRAFFTHTGVHGLMEAMDHGVPVISFPLFADQSFFAKWVDQNEVGIKLDHKTVTPEKALEVVKKVINDPKYKTNAVAVSNNLKDVPLPKIDEVAYWVEHVIRTKGARHLRPGSLNLYWFQRFGLDILAIFAILIFVPIWLLVKVTKICICFICRRFKTNDASIKKRKTKVDEAKKRS